MSSEPRITLSTGKVLYGTIHAIRSCLLEKLVKLEQEFKGRNWQVIDYYPVADGIVPPVDPRRLDPTKNSPESIVEYLEDRESKKAYYASEEFAEEKRQAELLNPIYRPYREYEMLSKKIRYMQDYLYGEEYTMEELEELSALLEFDAPSMAELAALEELRPAYLKSRKKVMLMKAEKEAIKESIRLMKEANYVKGILTQFRERNTNPSFRSIDDRTILKLIGYPANQIDRVLDKLRSENGEVSN